MEHLENDMDDLFQKAGELYPLKTSESDWKAVLDKLNEEGFGDQKGAIKMNSKELRNKRRWLLLLLLIPISVGSVVYFSTSKPKNIPADAKALTLKSNNARETVNATIISNTKNASANTNLKNEIAVNKTESEKEIVKEHSGIAIGNYRQNIAEQLKNQNTQVPLSNRKLQHDYTHSSKTRASFIESEIIDDNLAHTGSSESKSFLQETLAEKPLSLSVASPNEMISVQGKPLSSTDTKPLNDVPSTVNSKKPNNEISNKGFYVGIFGGPDLSSVKLQSVSQLGFSIGVSVGYRFNKRFAVETGLMWDKKYYYSSGEYFNKSETNIPASVNILNMNGSCNMFEIPLNFRYDFATTVNHGFYVKGGLSSYLMKKENYSMLLEHAGYQHDSAYSYNNSSRNIFSILQLSGGYEQKIGMNTNIWIEPYFKIPLQGVGVGSLPISSAGIYIGITYSFH
jgi:hypothetical protein